MNQQTAAALREVGLDPSSVSNILQVALAEDLGSGGDITSSATVPPAATLTVGYVSRQPGTAAGLPVLAALIDEHGGERATLRVRTLDGDRLAAGQTLAELTAPARTVLALERTTLNLLGHLCGVATLTRAWVDAVTGTPARIRDTRKTTPLLRALEKYAVRCGGGSNHRDGLDDAILIKDNHVAAAGGVGAALDAAHAAHPHGDVVIQVEVDNLDQLAEALDHGAVQVLLDNFDVLTCQRAVTMVRTRAPGTVIEASGGLALDSAAAVAATRVNFLAVGALTHSAPSLDIGLDVIEL